MSSSSQNDWFFVLGNDTRREIIRLLTQEAHYPFQISKIISVSQQTIERHLDILESKGIVTKTRKKSVEGPDRNYYSLVESVFLSATIGPKTFDISVSPIPKEMPEKIVEIPFILEEITDAFNTSNSSDLLERLLQILTFLEVNSHNYSKKHLEFISLKQFILHELYDHMTESGLEYTTRSILWSALEKLDLSLDTSNGTQNLEISLFREKVKGIIQKRESPPKTSKNEHLTITAIKKEKE